MRSRDERPQVPALRYRERHRNPEEPLSLGSAVALAIERIVGPVAGMHHAIARPWFDALGPIGKPVRVAHDSISKLVYESIRLGAVAIEAGLDAGMPEQRPATDSVRALVNGLWGDGLGRHESRLATSMSIRNPAGEQVSFGGASPVAFPTPTGQIVVLVHGLMKTEQCWWGDPGKPGLGRAIEQSRDQTPVAVRYNTGLPISANGESLALLLEELHLSWPVPVGSIALVGHSMGGLVIRSAYEAARGAGHTWVDQVSDIVTIGSPHRGAPLAKLVHLVALGLAITPQTRSLAEFLDGRSQGIKDLGSGDLGSVSDDGVNLAVPRSHVRHHFVAGVITANPNHPVGAVVGDLMVRPSSGTRAPQLEPTNVAVLGGVRHFDLLHDPAVLDRVMGWLGYEEAM